jgi:type I restriction enzyme, S subunit
MRPDRGRPGKGNMGQIASDKEKEVVQQREEGALPEGWARATMSQMIASGGVFIDGDWVESKDQDPDGDIRLIQLADIGDGVYRNKSDRYLTREKAIELGCTFLEIGDVLIARMPDPLGRACIFPGDPKPSVTVVDVCIVRPGVESVDAHWLMNTINSSVIRSEIESMQSGSTRKRISRGNLAKIEFPVPPLPEQHRIVAKIEELFTQLDAGVAALKRVQLALKRYWASVLKAACEGRLVAQDPSDEPASQLLERILQERRARWEADLRAKGKDPAKARYEEPAPPDVEGLWELPKGWVWTNVVQLAEAIPHALKAGPFGSALKKEYYVPHGYKIYGQEQVIRGDAFYGDYYIDEERYQSLKSCVVKPGDVLISLVGTIGKVLILPEGIEQGIINPRLLKLSLDRRLVAAEYIKTYLESHNARQFFSLAAHGGTMDVLNLTVLRELPIPLPPLNEQLRIIEEVERSISIVQELKATVEANLKRAERLRQSILKRAFEGKLVAQDPQDEPARILLNRIRTESPLRATTSADSNRATNSVDVSRPQQLRFDDAV